jgi:type II secretory ATPase GspE/PulE/Tfp pilus assembly ATPase PilB-like protein
MREGKSVDDVLRARGLADPAALEAVLEGDLGMPRLDLASYAPEAAALALVPGALARRLNVLPLFEIEGMLTVAVGDPFDVFRLDSLAGRLGVEVEPVLAEPEAIALALAEYYDAEGGVAGATVAPSAVAGEPSDQGGSGQRTATGDPGDGPREGAGEGKRAGAEAAVDRAAGSGASAQTGASSEPPSGATGPAGQRPSADAPEAVPELEPFAVADALTPAVTSFATPAAAPAPRGALVDLDVLAVADSRAVSVLVGHILERAMDRGADGVHVLPYKDDFFLVLRVDGRLEKLGAAPRSLQRPLVDGFLALARQTATTGAPITGMLRRRIRDRDVTLVMSLVSTLAGPRLVVGIEREDAAVPTLDGLGLTEQEARALEALAERGSGLVVTTSPAGEGRSTTYRALLARAAAAGRTAYSVERDASVTLPAVAQVLADATPGSSAGTCLRAGLLQDTDVVGLDDIESARELDALLTAAARGRLVVVSVRADGVAGALARLSALGADGASLASTLTAVVAQRSMREVCDSCASDERAAAAADVPGLGSGATTRRGTGCSACGGTGLAARRVLFEVHSVTPALRGALVSDGRKGAVRQALAESGPRTIAEAAAGHVRDGRISVSEFERLTGGAGA